MSGFILALDIWLIWLSLYKKKLEDVKARCDKAEKTTRKFEKDIQAAWREISDKVSASVAQSDSLC